MSVQEGAPCAGDRILVETLRRVGRIIIEKKRQRSPLPVNDLDSPPRSTQFILNDQLTSHEICRDTERAFPSVLCGWQ